MARSARSIPDVAWPMKPYVALLNIHAQGLFGDAASGEHANYLRFHLSPHSTIALAFTSLGMMAIGIVAWVWVKPRLD